MFGRSSRSGPVPFNPNQGATASWSGPDAAAAPRPSFTVGGQAVTQPVQQRTSWSMQPQGGQQPQGMQQPQGGQQPQGRTSWSMFGGGQPQGGQTTAPPPPTSGPAPAFVLKPTSVGGSTEAQHAVSGAGLTQRSSANKSAAAADADDEIRAAEELRGGASMFNRRAAAAARASAIPRAHARRPLTTSVSLETFLYFGAAWDVTFWIFSFCIFLWKGARLPYPQSDRHYYGLEVSYLFVYLVWEPVRIALGSKGNRSLHAPTLYAACALAGPVVWMHCYYMLQQTYVLHVDTFLNAVSIGFLGVQVLLSVFAATGFPRKEVTEAKTASGPVTLVHGGNSLGAGGGGRGAGGATRTTQPPPTFVIGTGAQGR